MRPIKKFAISALLLLSVLTAAFAADNLKLNPKLHYDSDSNDGPLITGDNIDAGVIPGKPAYVIPLRGGLLQLQAPGAPYREPV